MKKLIKFFINALSQIRIIYIWNYVEIVSVSDDAVKIAMTFFLPCAYDLYENLVYLSVHIKGALYTTPNRATAFTLSFPYSTFTASRIRIIICPACESINLMAAQATFGYKRGERLLQKAFARTWNKLIKSLYLHMDFKNNVEFIKKYTTISLQRGKVYIWITFIIGWYSLYLDMILKNDNTIDLLYRQNLVSVHVATVVLSMIYIIIYHVLGRSEKYRFSRITKAVILSHMFLSLLIAAFLSVNSQRFTGSTEVYILVVLLVALVVPMYPKWVLGIYGAVHISFLIALPSFFNSNSILIKQFNSTAIVVVALVLFLMLYRYNVKNFLNEEMLKEGKATFTKLFETNPFPLMISGFSDGKILYANQKAMSFYEIQKDKLSSMNYKDLYKNESDLHVICRMIEISEKVNDYVVEKKTTTGKVKCPVVNYELIDYFGEKAILSGISDIAEIKRIEHALSIHASTDILTGVLNRRVGMDLVRRRYETAVREKGQFTLCFFDIDNLKAVNDQFGHLEGDSLIFDVCRIIGEEIGQSGLLFRYGGDEFVVLFADEDEHQIDQICRRIAKRYDDLNQSHYKPYAINASLGAFTYKPEMNLDLEQIFQIVDRRMYNNKLEKK